MNAHTAHFPKQSNLIECDTCCEVGRVLFNTCGGACCRSCSIDALVHGCCYDSFEECVAQFDASLVDGRIERVTQ